MKQIIHDTEMPATIKAKLTNPKNGRNIATICEADIPFVEGMRKKDSPYSGVQDYQDAFRKGNLEGLGVVVPTVFLGTTQIPGREIYEPLSEDKLITERGSLVDVEAAIGDANWYTKTPRSF